MRVSGKNTIRLENILVGEVWICSGQSNMRVPLKSAEGGAAAVQAAAQPMLRLFSVELNGSLKPQEDCVGKWEPCTPDAVALFSAVGYFFGNELQRNLDVPVGLIHCSWGGQGIESFIPHAAMAGTPWGRGNAAKLDQAIKTYDPGIARKTHEEALTKWELANAAFEQAKKEGTAKGNAPRKPTAPDHITGP